MVTTKGVVAIAVSLPAICANFERQPAGYTWLPGMELRLSYACHRRARQLSDKIDHGVWDAYWNFFSGHLRPGQRHPTRRGRDAAAERLPIYFQCQEPDLLFMLESFVREADLTKNLWNRRKRNREVLEVLLPHILRTQRIRRVEDRWETRVELCLRPENGDQSDDLSQPAVLRSFREQFQVAAFFVHPDNQTYILDLIEDQWDTVEQGMDVNVPRFMQPHPCEGPALRFVQEFFLDNSGIPTDIPNDKELWFEYVAN